MIHHSSYSLLNVYGDMTLALKQKQAKWLGACIWIDKNPPQTIVQDTKELQIQLWEKPSTPMEIVNFFNRFEQATIRSSKSACR